MKSLDLMTPYELGESRQRDAIPYLANYLRSQKTNDIRLAASAVGKLAETYRDDCLSLIPLLLNALRVDSPQVRCLSTKLPDFFTQLSLSQSGRVAPLWTGSTRLR
jgi:hypothetical protein